MFAQTAVPQIASSIGLDDKESEAIQEMMEDEKISDTINQISSELMEALGDPNASFDQSTLDGFLDLTPDDYFKNDSHMNFKGGKKLAFNILNHLDDTFDHKKYENLILNDSIKEIEVHKHDLVAYINWSYSIFERSSYIRNDTKTHHQPKSLEFLYGSIPEEFKKCKERKSDYFKNDNSFSDLKVLIFHDSSIEYIKWYLAFYFREMFLFWDHGSLNKDLIKWYNPDLILEIRIERFIENISDPMWIRNKEII